MKKILVLSAWLALIGASQVGATDDHKGRFIGDVKRSERSALKLLERAGCDELWLSKMLEDSGLSGSNWRRLPLGTKLYLDAFSCKATPPEEVVSKSKALMAHEVARPAVPRVAPRVEAKPQATTEGPESGQVESRIVALKRENEFLKRDYEDLSKEHKKKMDELNDTTQRFVERSSEVERLRVLPRRYMLILVPMALMAGAILGIVITMLSLYSKKREVPKESAERRITTDVDPSLIKFK